MSTSILESDKDLEEVCKVLASGGIVRPELRDKLDKETDRIREEIRRKHGTLNIAVELVHEAREGV
jgi:hypothetical protein